MSTTDTRAAFEAWAAKEHPEAHHIMRDDGQYKHGGMRDWWPCWQAATHAAKGKGRYCAHCQREADNECKNCKGYGVVTHISGMTPDNYEECNEVCPDCKGEGTEAAKAEQSTPIALTLAQQIEESNYKRAFMEWSEKTDWVQEQISTFPINAIGKHRADIMREEIERLRTEAAKATGTAGELLPLPGGTWFACDHADGVQFHPSEDQAKRYALDGSCVAYFSADQMREYGQACADAREAYLMQSHAPLMDAASAKYRIEKAEAARQPAPVAIKTWQERVKHTDDATAMQRRSIVARDEEIADLRAALAARSQP